MKWKKVEVPTKREWKDVLAQFEKEKGFKFTKRARYFVDENLGEGTAPFLRELGANVTDVWEQGLVGKGDEHIWRYCQSERRILLSHDDDFLDDKLFPLRGGFGFVVLPHKGGGERELAKKLAHLVSMVGGNAGFMYETKVVIRENNHWEFRRFGQTGAIVKILYDVSDLNHTFILDED